MKPPRVLIADDCDTTLFLAKRTLARAGYVVEIVYDGGSALQAITERPGCYDVVVLDQDMPVLTGLLVLERLRGRGNDIAVVIHSDGDHESAAARLGATYVRKDPLCTALAAHLGSVAATDPPP